MDLDVLDSILDLNYPMDKEGLNTAVSEGPLTPEYTQFVEWITKELKFLYNLDEHVNSISSGDDIPSFLMEIGSFLKELGCEYKNLMEGNIQDRLISRDDRLKLLDFLIGELLGARMYRVKHPDNNLTLVINETPTASSMKKMLLSLEVPRPPGNLTPKMLFDKITSKVQDLGPKIITEPLFTGVLNDNQWKSLEKVEKDLEKEYTIRRQMLLKRLDVTIQSFQWSDKMKGRENDIAELYSIKRNEMTTKPSVKMSDLLAARERLAVLEKTSNSNVRKNTQSNVNKVIIGTVPDRGGRPADQQPPPPEMPSWAPRSSGPMGGGRGGGNDRGRGNWNSDRGHDRSVNQDRGRGNYNSRDTHSDRGRVQGGWNSDRGHRGGGYHGGGRGSRGGGERGRRY